MQKFILPSTCQKVLAKHPKAQDCWLIFDNTSDFAEEASKLAPTVTERAKANGHSSFYGSTTFDAAISKVKSGDISLVAESDKLMSKFENLSPINSTKFVIIDDVAGGVPNVPAYLAGIPLNMRRRQRIASDLAPLVIVADISSSQGVNTEQLRARGVAILALVRLLAIKRPVQLYIAAATGHKDKEDHFICPLVKVDSAPLDLARAAFMFMDPCVARGLGYGLGQAHFVDPVKGSQGFIPWAYNDSDLERATSAERFGKLLSSEVLHIPAAFINDPAISKPEVWLTEMLKKYGGELIQ